MLSRHSATHARIALGAAVLVLLWAKYQLLSTVNVNWDEFRFLSRIHELHRGELSAALQTFHVRLFGWVPGVAGGIVDQVLAGRTAMFILRLGATLCVFLIARKLLGDTAACFAAYLSLAFSLVLRHGEDFRADPIISFLFLVAVTLLILRFDSRLAVVGAAGALSLAIVVSIKTVVYLPAVGMIFLAAYVGGAGGQVVVRRLGLFSAVAVVSAAVLYGLHGGALPESPASGVNLMQVGSRMFGGPADIGHLVDSLRRDWSFWLLLAYGAARTLAEARSDDREVRARAVVLLGMLIPLGTILLYRNSFAYYYVCLVPAASLVASGAVQRLEGVRSWRPAVVGLVVVLLSAPQAFSAWRAVRLLRPDTVNPQRQVLAAIREVFPEPVPYIDRCSMAADYPKVGPFMSTFVLSRYRARGEPEMQRLVRERQPVFILANVSGLELGMPWDAVGRLPHRLLQSDFEYLQRHFVPHWGPIWVAGRRIEAGTDRDHEFEIPVAGPYTVELPGSVMLDRRSVRDGEVVHLIAGTHSLRSQDTVKLVTLRYGDHLPRPTRHPPVAPLFLDLGFRDLARR